MNKYWMSLIAGVLVCLLSSCEQYAIFDAIAKEVKPKPALIKGSSSKIVKSNDGPLYVANGALWEFAGVRWAKVSAPANVRDVAVVGTDVYVISVGNSPSLSIRGGGTIEGVQGTVQGIYGAKDTLFIAAGSGNAYSVYTYRRDSGLSAVVASGLLKGVAYYNDGTKDHYYLATSAGLYYSSETSFLSIADGNFLGVIALALSNRVVAVTESAVYEVTGASLNQRASGDSLTGALGVFGNILYLGRSRGYRTIDTDSQAGWDFKTPSIDNYTSTIAQVRVTSMNAVSADLIFASVLSSDPKRSGLMSLRGGSWNMEE
jgi:hypothetical protein